MWIQLSSQKQPLPSQTRSLLFMWPHWTFSKTLSYETTNAPEEALADMSKESNFMKGKRRQRKAHAITRDNEDLSNSSDDEYAYAVEEENKLSTKPQMRLNDSFDVTFLVDTGATVNITDSTTYESLQREVRLAPAKTNIFAYGSTTPLQLKGCFNAMIELNLRYTVSQFYVMDGSGGNLLSGKTAHELKLIQLVNKINETQTSNSKSGTTDDKEITEKKINRPVSTDGNVQGLLRKY